MAASFGERKIFGKLPRVHCLDNLWVENFDKITLSRMVKGLEANYCLENSKWLPFLGGGKFFENCQEYITQITCGSKISTKLLYHTQFRR